MLVFKGGGVSSNLHPLTFDIQASGATKEQVAPENRRKPEKGK